MKELKRESIWEIVQGASTLEGFSKNIVPDFVIKKEVPESIKEELRVIRRLLVHSFFEYRFIDLAVTQAVIVFERALKHRYYELNGADWSGNLKKLSEWFSFREYFESPNAQQFIDAFRSIRNSRVHSKEDNYSGLMLIRGVYKITYAINDLYEDFSLREERRKIKSNISAFFQKVTQCGGKLVYPHLPEEPSIIFRAELIFFNNKAINNIFDIILFPISLAEKEGEATSVQPLGFYANSVKIRENKLLLMNESFTLAEIYLLEEDEDKERYLNWKNSFTKEEEILSVYFSYHQMLEKKYQDHLNEFYLV